MNAPRPQPHRGSERPQTPIGPFLLVGAACVFGLVNLRPELAHVPYGNDSSVHLAMVRWAALRISDGHLPFDGWFPYLGMGASRFHHYQSLPHILTGYLAGVTDPRTAFAWVQYLLIALWPICIYWSGRQLELPAWSSATAAFLSPLVVSAPSLGYEWGSYMFRGWGAWTQLWGMWLLPPSWALGWRAVSGRSGPLWASVVLALSIACHLITGYLALLSLGVWVVIRPPELVKRLGRAVVVAAASLLMSAWMLVPLLVDARFTARDEFSTQTFYYDSFGAKRVLLWAVSGQLFDAGRLATLTVLVAVGVIACLRNLRSTEWSGALLGAGLLSMFLFFGRPTLGPLLDLLPGSGDIFFRRFVIGVHLAGIFLAGIGGAWGARLLWGAMQRFLPHIHSPIRAMATGALSFMFVLPVLIDRVTYMNGDRIAVEAQRRAEATEGSDLRALLARVASLGGGRVYDGDIFFSTPTTFRIGSVPVYAEVLDASLDGLGFVRPTWSLSSDIEYRFDEREPAQYDVFNVRFVVLPNGQSPAAPASLIESQGELALWEVTTSGYIQLVDTQGMIEADRTNIGKRTASFLTSPELAEGVFPTIAFAGEPAARASLSATADPPPGAPGMIISQSADLPNGRFQATVYADRAAVVLLKETYDPRWRVSVDGSTEDAEMIAPSFVGVGVQPGQHTVIFEYVPYPNYGPLFALGALTFLFAAVAQRVRRPMARVENSHPQGA